MLYDSAYIKVQNYTILSEIKTEVIIRDVRGGSNWQKHKKGGGSFGVLDIFSLVTWIMITYVIQQ